MRTNEIAIWLVEDDREYQASFLEVIQASGDIVCQATFGSVEALQGGMDDCPTPDVVLMDIGLPGLGGIQGVRWLKERQPDVPVVMITVQDSSSVILEAFRAGASGYILKDTSSSRIQAAIREAAVGGTLMPAPVAEKVLGLLGGQASSSEFGLTRREKEVLALMADGLPHALIGERLFISNHTVDNHLRSIYRKLHVHSGIQAVAKALRAGIV
ncbi:MAG: response regulator transcription factor [Rhodothermales bacterium]|nr:response regulator transcription factor [Rhodothermales bacterium]